MRKSGSLMMYPLEHLVERGAFPAHEFQLVVANLVGEHHAADGAGQVRVGLDSVVIHVLSPFVSFSLTSRPDAVRHMRPFKGLFEGCKWAVAIPARSDMIKCVIN